jgi:hypothetical protein
MVFIKGKSGNPKGGYSASHQLSHLVRTHTDPIKLIERMNRIALNDEAKFETRDQLQAIKELLDRGYGKPPQTVSIEKPIDVECFKTDHMGPQDLDNFERLLVLAGAIEPDVNEPDATSDE